MNGAGRSRFRRVAWVNVLGNAAKIVVEGSIGLLFGSVALLADAAHSVADLIASIVVLRWGDSRFVPADSDHPHGHGRFEPMTALVVGGTIVLMGGGLLFESVEGLRVGPAATFSYALLGGLAFAILLMAAIYRYTTVVNATVESTALHALAADCRNDVFTSLAALAGIVGLMLGYPAFDPIAGGVVSLLVVVQGVTIARENLTYLLGSAAPDATQGEVRDALLDHPDVAGVHDLVVYHEGTTLEVEAHVEVDGDMALRRAHEIESELISRVRGIDGIGDAHVHLDPSGIGEWKDAPDRGPRDGE